MRVSFRIITGFISISMMIPVCLAQDSCMYYKQAIAPAPMQKEIGAITVDSDICRHTGDDFHSVRLYDERGNEVPYVIRFQTTNEVTETAYMVSLRTIALEELPDNRISITLQRKKDQLVPSEFVLRTPNDNFEKSVSVYGSNDRQEWQLLIGDQPIFDYTRFIDLRNTSIRFAAAPYEFYKIVIDNVSQAQRSQFSEIFTKYSGGKIREQYEAFMRYEGTLRINAIDARGKEEKRIYGRKKEIDYPLEIVNVAQNTDKKATDIYCNSDRQPVTRFLFSVASKNFNRKVDIFGTDDEGDEPQWKSIAQGTILDINAGNFKKEELTIYSRVLARFARYRIRIYNQDNMPLEVVAVKGRGSAYEIVFFHNEEKSVKVCYGNDAMQYPRYDVSSVLAQLPAIDGDRWNLGVQYASPGAAGTRKTLISSKILLVSALILMVAVLGYLIAFSVKKVDEQTKP